jgi:hypothetical protein
MERVEGWSTQNDEILDHMIGVFVISPCEQSRNVSPCLTGAPSRKAVLTKRGDGVHFHIGMIRKRSSVADDLKEKSIP